MVDTQPGDQRSQVARTGVSLAVVAAIACVAQFMVVLDASIVNVALPDMRRGLDLSTSAQQWIVDGYLVTFGGFLLLASRAADLFGRRRVFLVGLAVFTAASLVGGLAQDGAMLLAARFVQGVGAAALAPSSLSLITASHTDRAQRLRAMTWWGVAAAGAGAAGVVLGGLLTGALSWRAVLLVNVPIGIGLFVAGAAALQPSGPAARTTRIDVPGAVSATAAAAALIYGVSAAPDSGWGSWPVVGTLIVGIVLAAVFVTVERRTRDPLVPAGIFALHNVAVGNVMTALLGVVMTAPLFFLSLYLQQAIGYGALRAGLSLLPMAAVVSAGVLVSQRLIPLVGARRLVAVGGVLVAVGLLWLAELPTHPAYLVHVLGPTIVAGAGTSIMMMPAIAAATDGVAPHDAGIASGVMNMARQLGAALGLAALVTVSSAVATTRHAATHAVTVGATVDGYRVALIVIAAVGLVTAATALALRPPTASADREPDAHTRSVPRGSAAAGSR